MMIFETHPIEKFIINELKNNNHDVSIVSHKVYQKYPFFAKKDIKKITTTLLEIVASKGKLKGFWIKNGNNWELITKKNILKSWNSPNQDAIPSETGNSNRFYIMPQGQPADRSLIPNKQAIQQKYEEMFDTYKENLGNADIEDLNKALLEELANKYSSEELRDIKLRKKNIQNLEERR